MAKYVKMKCNYFHVHAWVKLGFSGGGGYPGSYSKASLP